MSDKVQGYSTAKRLPIVFCLDVSPSMGWEMYGNSSAIELLNTAVENFIEELKKHPKARGAAEIAFVTYSTDIVMETEFESIMTLKTPVFSAVDEGGTQTGMAVLKSIEKIEKRRDELEDSEIGYFAPFMVLVTDGNPDKNDNINMETLALAKVKQHCYSHLGASEIIVPFIIGVGDHIEAETLNKYSAGFTKGYFPIKGDASKVKVQFSKVFELIGDSTTKTVNLNSSHKDAINTIQCDMNDLLDYLAGE